MDNFKEVKRQETKVEPIKMDMIRPLYFKDYIGQEELKSHMAVVIESAKIRSRSLPHTLIYGQPGLGKTTLATILANEMGTNIVYTSAPAIEKPADLVSLLIKLQDGDILFIDEIHGLKIQTEEIIYPAMEDRVVDINIPSAKDNNIIRIPLKNFTLIGATTKPGKMSNPFRDRFPIQLQLKYYEVQELSQIIKRTASIVKLNIDDDAAYELAKRSRGTARIANNLLDRAGDYAIVKNNSYVNIDIVREAMDYMKIDEIGLDSIDRKIIYILYNHYKNKATGLKNLANTVQEDVETVENIVEPYLLQQKIIIRTERGRVLTDFGIEYAKKIANTDIDINQ